MSLLKTESFLDENKALTCIHCGLCLSSCPTYLETGDENDSPRGRIYLMRAVQEGRMPLEKTAVRHIDRCLGCRACEAACPSGVEYGELLEHTRDHIEKAFRRSPFQTFLRRVLIERIFPHSNRMKLALLPVRFFRKLGLQKLLPNFAKEAMALVPDDYESGLLPEFNLTKVQPSRGKVGFVSGCVMSAMFAKTNRASVALLNLAGFDVIVPQKQSCCGALYAHSGRLDEARQVARKNISTFAKAGCESVIINAAGCGSTLKEYENLLCDSDWSERGRRFSRGVFDLTEFLVEKGFVNRLQSEMKNRQSYESQALRDSNDSDSRELKLRKGDDENRKVTFHDACHLAHPQGITAAPRQLIAAIAGDRFVPLIESDVCCGSAGSYNLTEPKMAARLQHRKLQHVIQSQAEVVVTTNPGCILQIQSGLKDMGANVEVKHIADYLYDALGLDDRLYN